MPRQQLDLTNLITQNDRATPYLEALFYELFKAIETAPVTVMIASGVATIDLTEGGQFNITATANFEIVIIGVADRVSNKNIISITNPGGVYDLTDITSTGATVYKTFGSTIAIAGAVPFTFLVNVPSDDRIDVLPFEMEPV